MSRCTMTTVLGLLAAGCASRQPIPVSFTSPETPSARELPRAYPAGHVPQDVRLGDLRDLNGYFPFSLPTSRVAWEQRADHARRELLVSLGLWPLPTRTPLNPVVHGPIDRGTYTVEKVYFESLPGFYVTGNLYRPKGRPGPYPVVLSPHGHWADGRFYDAGAEGVKKQIAQGAEQFEEGGRSPLQARCAGLARLGCVVFHYDMIGYADSVQIPHVIAHGFEKQRPEMNTIEDWGLFSPQAEAHAQSVMGLQTWSSMRALDFLLGLPDIDPRRVAVTGASGGGTQTFILCALDPRPTVAFPAVMVSTAMQGGCTCENACGLRIDTGNVEIAALFAPKPLGLTTANDWTKEMSTKGFPELQQHYARLGEAANVQLFRGEQFEHNYNHPSRIAMYGWLNQHLRLGQTGPIEEQDYQRLTREEMSVWDGAHPKPAGGPDFERRLLRWLADDAAQQLTMACRSRRGFQKTYGAAIEALLGRRLDQAGDSSWTPTASLSGDGWVATAGVLRNQTHGEELPVLFIEPKAWTGQAVLWVDPAGKSALFAPPPDGSRLRPEVRALVDAGAVVVGVDLLYQGEFLADGVPFAETRKVKNPREAAAYTFGYNRTLFAQRVHDILTVVGFLRQSQPKLRLLDLVGLHGAGPWVAAARSQCRDAVDRAAIDTGGFRFGQVLAIHDPGFLPGGAKYGDLPGMLAAGAPGKLWLAGEAEAGLAMVREQYRLCGDDDGLTVYSGEPQGLAAAAVQFLLPSGPRPVACRGPAARSG